MILEFLGYLTISIFFNARLFWNQLFFDSSKIGAVYGEVQAYEWLTDKFYKTMISGHNPFGLIKNMLYPFGFNLGLVDAGNGIFFTFFRPFLSSHQSLSLVIVLSLLAANAGMYLLLRKLNINRFVSFILGAAYGYMTFLMPRMGHLSYWCHFIFPWYFYFVFVFFKTLNKLKKILSIIGSSIFFVLSLWLNFYYFVMLLISIGFLLIFYLIFNTKLFFKQLKENWKYLVLKTVLVVILLIPWLSALYDLFLFDQIPKTEGWGGAIEFGSDLFNYFIPSEYGYFVNKLPFLLKPFSLFLKLYTPSARLIFENFTYPGIIILVSYFLLPFIFKKIKKDIRIDIWPFLFTSLVFFILTLGPFLHVFGHWTLTVDEGIKIVIPLPYIILHYIPFLNNIRVPGRLIVGFIFFAYIVSAYLLNFYWSKINKNRKFWLFTILLIIFILDHRYYVDPKGPPKNIYPYKIYQVIKNDKENSTILEIPFTVRDGFTYFGDVNAFQMIIGESIHGKQVLGGYTGRIADYKKSYYQNNPFLGYLGRLIDSNLLNNPGIEKNDLSRWRSIDLEKSKDAINFLDIKYIISNDDMKYMSTLSYSLRELGYERTKQEKNFSLWTRLIENKEFLNVDMKDPFSSTFLGFGWHDPESEFRWADRRTSAMFKILNSRRMVLNFKAATFFKNQSVNIYLNKKKVGRIALTTNMKNYSLPINEEFEKGINFIYFYFDKSYHPYDVLLNNLDKRQLSAQFNKVWLTDK